MKYFVLFIVFILSLQAEVISINKTSDYDTILSKSAIYIDHSRSLTIDGILNKQVQFTKNSESLLGYGYSPNFDVWIRFTLKNDTNENIKRILEYENPMTSKVVFFEENILKKNRWN